LIAQRRAFGDRLRRQRERQNVSLAQIAEATKVTASLFAGLERGDCSRWPGGVYNRAFVRGYATAVQLDPDEVTAEFVEYYEAPSPETAERTAAKGKAVSPARPPLRIALAVDPSETWRRTGRSAALILADILAIAALTAGVVLSTSTPLWNALAITAVAYHVLARVVGSIPRVDRLWREAPGLPDEEVPVGQSLITDH
jgi:transcriptional regulator with XRE-family HTH domain